VTDELERLRKQNERLKALIREAQIKLRDSRLQEDNLRDELEISQNRRVKAATADDQIIEHS
jgi:hypothetical protein